MTSGNINSFVGDLVEMAKAMETLPQVQESLRQAEETRGRLVETINQMAADLEQSRTYAASLEQKVRTVEAERDDAELRFLELDEKAHKALAAFDYIQMMSTEAKATLDPPKPQPEPVVEQPPVPEVVQSIEPQPQGQGEALPTSEDSIGTTFQTEPSPASQDQSEANPTAYTMENQSQSATGTATENASSHSRPYSGKRYIDVPYYVSREDWLAGGGTKEGYSLMFPNQ